MAEKEKQTSNKQENKENSQKQDSVKHKQEETEMLIRIFGYDIKGSKKVFIGLTEIKGISWAISNALCKILKIPVAKKIGELSKAEISTIETTLKKLAVPDFLKNRRNDVETGETFHLYGTDLDMKRDFDIKRLREIKSYRGIRHALKLPVRGQRTRSHFRTKSAASGVRKK